MKKVLLSAGLILIGLVLFAHEPAASLRGRVSLTDGSPAAWVTIQLKEITRSTVTDEDGSFSFEGLAAGTYTLEVSLIGHESLTQTVGLAVNEIKEVNFTVQLSRKQLEEVVVHSRANRFTRSTSDQVMRMRLKNIENPQAYSTITNELINEQIVTDFSQVMKNAPGVYKIQGTRGINTEGGSFYTMRGFRTEAALLDGAPAQTNGEMDPANIEKIEVVKGPSGTLFGSVFTSFGGLVNIITKKPQENFGGTVSYTGGSFRLNRLAADVYGAVNDDKTLLMRVNAAWQQQGSFQDAGFRKSIFVAPSVLYRASDRLDIRFDAGFFRSQATSPGVIFLSRTRPFQAKNPDELNFDWTRSYTSNDLVMTNPVTNIRARVSYKLSSRWTSTSSYSSNTRSADGFYQYQFIRGAVADTLLERNIALLNTTNTSQNLQQFFTGDVKIAGLRNRVLVGLDYLHQSVNNSNSPYIVFDNLSGISNDPKYTQINRSAVEAKLGASTAAPTKNEASGAVYSAYLADAVNITDNLLVLLSLRLDHFYNRGTYNQATNTILANSSYKQTTLSPKFGVTYQVIPDKVSVFANFQNGFTNVAPVTQPLPDISGSLKPQQANQAEAGVKLNLLAGRLSVMASYYDIRVDNMTRTEVIERDNTNYTITVQNGTQLSKGVEMEVVANPLPGLNILAGYAYNDSKLTKAAAAVEGRRPPGAGPAQLVNSWISYSFVRGPLKGFGIAGGGNYISEHRTANSAVTGVFTLPDYALINATAWYETRWYRLSIKLDNIGNVRYFTGQGVLSAQMPRNFAANLTVKF